MKLKENISLEDVCGKVFNKRAIEFSENGKAAFTHYIQNHKNGGSSHYRDGAISHVKHALEYKYPNEEVTFEVAEEALQYMLFDMKKDIPFPEPLNPEFKFIDLFAGIGGFRLALQNLGGKCVYTSEWDEQAKKTYQANFGEVPFGDITKEETKKFIPDGFDVLCAGFPCQAFSIAGKRGGFEDTRGTLFFDVAEIIRRKRPKAIFLENVKGLFNHDRGKTLRTILNVLREDLDYFVPDPKILNAKDFGVAQNRERIFIVGFRKDLGITEFSYPEATGVKKCFDDVKEEKVVSVKYYLSDTYLNTLIAHKKRHENKGNGFGYEIISDKSIANAVVCGGMGRERNLVIDHRLEDFTPVTNIKGEVNRQGIRKMTPREWARLQGFPDNFKIPVADASAYKQFGNSVAVPAIQATANKIIKILKEANGIKG
jgi:DNA (cytosine-5)-methyltransferase 1